MPEKNNKVNKMLSPEETSLLQDVVAGLGVLLQGNNAGSTEEAVEGTGAQQVEMESGASPKPEIETEEEPVVKSDDGPTANDKAEERTEDGTVVTDANMGSVMKMLAAMASKNTVQKSANPVTGINADTVAQIVLKSIQPIVAEMGSVKKDMSNMLDALGFGEAMDTIEKSVNPIQQVQKSTSMNAPVTNQDSLDLVNLIGQAVAKELGRGQELDSVVGGPKYSTTNTEAHKSLGQCIIDVHTQRELVGQFLHQNNCYNYLLLVTPDGESIPTRKDHIDFIYSWI